MPARSKSKTKTRSAGGREPVVARSAPLLPTDTDDATLEIEGAQVRVTNMRKIFWPKLGLSKGDLIRYYVEISPYLLPHIRDRAMVMKRYPHGAEGSFFFMKRTPTPRPGWLQVCPITHDSGSVIEFPMIQDLASLIWVVNLGCIDLNPWYARCDDTNRPDFLHFDLDPVVGAGFDRVSETALRVRDTLEGLGMTAYAKTTGSKGIHVYVPIVRGPVQKEVWAVAKTIAFDLEARHPGLITAEYRIAKRPRGRVLVDYNQNAWGRTLASIYSVRPRPLATVSIPVTWDEIEKGVTIEDFRMDNVRDRVRRIGDLWKPLLAPRGRFRFDRLVSPSAAAPISRS